jgi:hypothetical protein
MNKKQFILFLSLLFLISANIGCSDNKDEQPIINNNANSILVGDWELVKKGEFKWDGPKTTLAFGKDETFSYQQGEQTRQGKYTIPNIDYDFSDRGALCFMVRFDVSNTEESIRYYVCHFWADSLRLTNLQEQSIIDNSHLYIKKK